MKKFTVAIIDDEKEARILLQTMLSKYEFVEIIMTAGNVEEAVLAIMKNPPDLIFLDIHMPHKDGFELVKEIGRMRINSKVVFVTAYNSYAIKAIKVNAFDYLLKPIDPDELEDTLIRYRQLVLESDHFRQLKDTIETFRLPRRVKFDTNKGFVIINSKDIIYLQYDEKKVHLFLLNGNREILELNISHVLDKLPPNIFVEIEKSTIINTDYLSRLNVETQQCELSVGNSNITLPFSGNRLPDIENALND